jgi:hypothetical protein
LSAATRVPRWQIESRICDDVTVDWIGGRRLAARRGMTGLTGNIYAGLHEFADMAFLLHFLRPSDVFADVGANVGSYTILASGVIGCPTVAFEPDPLTAAAFERNAEASFAFQQALTRILTMSQSVFLKRLRCESSGRWFNLDRRSTSGISARTAVAVAAGG